MAETENQSDGNMSLVDLVAEATLVGVEVIAGVV